MQSNLTSTLDSMGNDDTSTHSLCQSITIHVDFQFDHQKDPDGLHTVHIHDTKNQYVYMQRFILYIETNANQRKIYHWMIYKLTNSHSIIWPHCIHVGATTVVDGTVAVILII